MSPTPGRIKLPGKFPVLPLRSTIVYPLGVVGVQIGIPSSLEMLAAHPDEMLIVATVIAPGGPEDPIQAKTLEKIGVLTRLSDRLNMPGGTVQATLQGLQRVRLAKVEQTGEYFVCVAEAVEEVPADEGNTQELIARILTALDALAEEVERIPREVPRILRMNVANPSRFADLVATLANFSVRHKDQTLQLLDISDRLNFMLGEMNRENRRLRKVERAAGPAGQPEEGEGQAPAAPEVQKAPGGTAADLRRQIKRLQAELGEVDPMEREVVELLRRVEAAELPQRAAAQARSEVDRLRHLNNPGLELGEIRSYVDWLVSIPWKTVSTDGAAGVDLERVEAALETELVGLDEPKQRLLDYLAVARLRGDMRGPIPCFVGPPDVGKRSLVQALATGLGRPLARLELGGRGEADLVGIRRTRPGAHPGKFIGSLRDVGVADPVFVLQELDEVGLGKVEGDPVEALEEALDWEHRQEFVDRYLEIPFDLSRTLFLATAQDFARIPRDLRRLLVEIRLAGYTPEEKTAIAREKLVPELIEQHGLEAGDIEFSDEALFFLARGYAREAGLGSLIRVLSSLLRTRARAKAQGDHGTWTFTPDRMEDLLGLPRYVATPAESAPEVGVVTGLAWTAAGGELMFIEALRMPGTGRLIITGLLGDVMRESVNAAYSYVRSRAAMLGIEEESFRESDLHVHFPVGAIPKDGPSAGIAVTLAIASTLSNRPVRHDVAMTGEVTLRGKVLEIGGVKEKVLAAYRAGLREVMLPRGNERDLRDVPQEVRDAIRYDLVERMEDVFQLALLNPIDLPRHPGTREEPAIPEEPAPESEEERELPPQREPRVARG